MVREHGGVGHSRLTHVQIVVNWCNTDCMEELRESRDIIEGWEMPGPHEQQMVLPSSPHPMNAFRFAFLMPQKSERQENEKKLVQE